MELRKKSWIEYVLILEHHVDKVCWGPVPDLILSLPQAQQQLHVNQSGEKTRTWNISTNQRYRENLSFLVENQLRKGSQ